MSLARALLWTAITALLWGCGEDAKPTFDPAVERTPRDNPREHSECPTGQFEGDICLPESPRPTPPDACPSGVLDDAGVCEALRPIFTDWDCPAGWSAQEEAFEDVAEDVRPAPFTRCAPPTNNALCPEDDPWGEEASLRALAPGYEGVIRYVKPDCAIEGLGTRTDPFDSLADALEGAPTGSILALASGTYSGALVTDGSVAVVGACSGGVRISGAVDIEGGEHKLAGIALDGSPGIGLRIRGGTVDLIDVEIVAPDPSAAEEIDPDAPLTPDGREGIGVWLSEGANVRAQNLRVRGASTVGILVEGAQTLFEADNIAIENTQPHPTAEAFGQGMIVRNGAFAAVFGAVITGNHTAGIAVVEANLTMADAHIADTRPRRSDGRLGVGLSALVQASVSLDRVLLRGNHTKGLELEGEAVELVATDLAVVGTLPQPSDMKEGIGVFINKGADAQIERLLSSHNHRSAIDVVGLRGPPSSATLTDVTLCDTQPQQSDLSFGIGIGIVFGSTAAITRLRSLRNHTADIIVPIGPSVLTATDVILSDTKLNLSLNRQGVGFAILGEGRATFERISLKRHKTAAAFVENATVEITDLTLRDTLTDPEEGQIGGTGAVFTGESELVLRRGLFERNRNMALAIADGANATVSDIRVRDTDRGICFGDDVDCDFEEVAHGIGIINATATIDQFYIHDNALAGLQLMGDVDISLSNGVITRNRLGLNLQSQSVDLEEDFQNVQTYGNDIDFDNNIFPALDVDALFK